MPAHSLLSSGSVWVNCRWFQCHVPASHVYYTFSPAPWLTPCRSGRKRALFHYVELSCNWNNTYCIRAHNHVKVSCFITGNSALCWPIWKVTFSRDLLPQETVAGPIIWAPINVLALRPHIPPLASPPHLPPFLCFLIIEEGVKGKRGCRKKLNSVGGGVWRRCQSNPTHSSTAFFMASLFL